MEVGGGGCCSEMGPNFSMIFLLFLICSKAAPREKLDTAPKFFSCLMFGKSSFHCRDQYSNCKRIFSPASLLLIVDLPNTRYYSVDR